MKRVPDRPPVSAAQLEHLIAVHTQRYTSMLDRCVSGAPGYRESELISLLAIWKSIQAKFTASDVGTYTLLEINEIADAYEDTCFDQVTP